MDSTPNWAANKSFEKNIRSLRAHLGPSFFSAFEDPLTIEILLNPDGLLWQEKFGQPMKPIGTLVAHRARAAMNIVASMIDTELNAGWPLLEAEFPLDGSRFSGQVPPIVSAPVFALRKKASSIFTLEQYVENSVMTPQQKTVICEAVREHKNILVIGGTSSGKTTLTNAIIQEMTRQFPDERFCIAEDLAEIQCDARNCVFYRTTSTVSLAKILEAELRMRPDRLIVGEVRNHAALDMLDGWNTGHEGGIATLHANNAASGLSRLRSLVSRHPHAPKIIEEVIGEAIHMIVFISKTPEGRRVKDIITVDGYNGHSYNLSDAIEVNIPSADNELGR